MNAPSGVGCSDLVRHKATHLVSGLTTLPHPKWRRASECEAKHLAPFTRRKSMAATKSALSSITRAANPSFVPRQMTGGWPTNTKSRHECPPHSSARKTCFCCSSVMLSNAPSSATAATSDPAPVTPGVEQRRHRGVHCIRFVGLTLHSRIKSFSSRSMILPGPRGPRVTQIVTLIFGCSFGGTPRLTTPSKLWISETAKCWCEHPNTQLARPSCSRLTPAVQSVGILPTRWTTAEGATISICSMASSALRSSG